MCDFMCLRIYGCMYLTIYLCTNARMSMRMYAFMSVHAFVYIHVCMYDRMFMFDVFTYAFMNVCTHACNLLVCVFEFMYVRTHVCMHVCPIHTYA